MVIYPGSFNPWHDGHQDVLNKAQMMFDKVKVVQLHNPTKEYSDPFLLTKQLSDKGTEVIRSVDMLKDVVALLKPKAIIKGLRNSTDFEYEKIQQYWNEDLGISIPFIYIISNRNLVHISSSAIKQVAEFNNIRR